MVTVATLPDRFAGLWQRLGAITPPGPLAATLLQAYAEPHRAFHTLVHLCHCLEEFDNCRHLALNSDAVELALWFHDAVYDPRGKTNERDSAVLALEALEQGQISLATKLLVPTLLLATTHEPQPPTTVDAQLIVDIDLAILGQPQSRFEEYERQIRQEYAMVHEDKSRLARSAILEKFLRQPSISHSVFFQQQYEVSARVNLLESLRRLAP